MADDPSLGEVVRLVGDLKLDLRGLRGELVRRDVYEAHLAANDLRLKAIENDLQRAADERSATRRLVIGAVLMAAGSAATQVIAAVVTGGGA